MFVLSYCVNADTSSTKKSVPSSVSSQVLQLLGMGSVQKEPVGGNDCSTGGASCAIDSDCCSDNCRSGKCQSGFGGCSYGGARCVMDSDCCSDNCRSGECQQSCVSDGSYCTSNSECCTSSCHNNSCGRRH